MATSFPLPPVFPQGQLTHVPIQGTQGRVAVEDSGPPDSALPTLLFLHGLGDFRQTYRFLAPKFHSRGHRVLLADLRGCGESTTNFPSYTPVDVANDAVAVLDHFKVNQPAVIVSNSLSASSSAYVAAKHPERVAALIGTGPFLRDPPGSGWLGPVSHVLFARPWGAAAWVSFWKTLTVKKPADFDDYTKAMNAATRSEGHLAAIGGMIRGPKKPCWDVAGDVKCPVLLVFGSKDPDFKDPAAEGEEHRRQLKSAKVVKVEVLPGLGHYPASEDPEAVFKLATDFLEASL
ncbi:hypothetical protein KFL_002170130 [Klebsormidium nitens]|uniref:AB hydrolase-1 domain-containing protein n=1 Tax=Klebsormidium nitens TaxID=105231 RepID=A0A1Y1I6G7_KLENI|nr:hypothetical protein KFL_002170130 [Klebsormidium nitens]|eukprot:GAQ85019.1 hypothetical protein KFL_002170130 [Klebsormidium nitens]